MASELGRSPQLFASVILGSMSKNRKLDFDRPGFDMDGTKLLAALFLNLPGEQPPKEEVQTILSCIFSIRDVMRDYILDALVKAVRIFYYFVHFLGFPRVFCPLFPGH